MKEAEKVIVELEIKALNHEEAARIIRESIQTLRSVLQIKETETKPSPSISKRTTKTPSLKVTAKPPSKRGSHRGGGKFSKYKGVTKGCTRKNGTYSFKAMYWTGKKLKCLGLFEIEEEAAAHAAKARGELELADKLFAIAQEKQGGTTKKGKNKLEYECSHCKFTYSTRPIRCPNCDSATFKKIAKQNPEP